MGSKSARLTERLVRIDVVNGNSKLDRDSDDRPAGRACRNAVAEIRRPAWKDLIYRGCTAFEAASYILQRLVAHGGEIRSVCQP
jgi:hypothetical protein